MNRQRLTAVVLGGVGACVLMAAPARAVLSDAQKCQTKKMKAVRVYLNCRLKAEEKLVKTGDATKYSDALAKCAEKFGDSIKGAWVKADLKYGEAACPWWGAASAAEWFQTALTDTTDRVVGALGAASTPRGGPLPSCQLPATGQTVPYESGDDGDVRAGSTLAFVHSGDVQVGTWASGAGWWQDAILDQRTGLMWEQKDDVNGAGEDPTNARDVDNLYCWDPAVCPGDSIWDHVDALNNHCWFDPAIACSSNGDCPSSGLCGYAGYRDWRVPNVKELQSIVDYGRFNPAIDPVFDTDCTPGCTVCSCTQSNFYWSATTFAGGPSLAWLVGFNYGGVVDFTKAYPVYVRAVRSGL